MKERIAISAALLLLLLLFIAIEWTLAAAMLVYSMTAYALGIAALNLRQRASRKKAGATVNKRIIIPDEEVQAEILAIAREDQFEMIDPDAVFPALLRKMRRIELQRLALRG